jgi:hypothetical protein
VPSSHHQDDISHSSYSSSPSSQPSSSSAAAAASIRLDPMSHVRHQMKQSLVQIAEGFEKHITASKSSTALSPYLFTAEFEVDEDLNMLLMDSYHSYMKGEDNSEIVYLDDEVFGSALKLLEPFNSTNADPLSSDEKLPGRYEWLIQARTKGDTLWKFKYPWKHKSNECTK